LSYSDPNYYTLLSGASNRFRVLRHVVSSWNIMIYIDTTHYLSDLAFQNLHQQTLNLLLAPLKGQS